MDYKSCPEPIELEECRKVGSPGGGNRFSNVGAFAHQILVFLEAWKGPWEKVIVQFLGKKESLCAERKAVYPSYKADQVLYAFHLVYHRYKYKTRRWSGDYQSDESSPVFSLIRVSRKKKIALLTDGHVFVEFEDHTRVIAFTHTGNFTIFVRALGSTVGAVNRFLKEVDDAFKENSFLKGEKLEWLGERTSFLDFPPLSWKDIVLSDEVLHELRLNLKVIDKKFCRRFSLPWRRGILLEGEPGTGKTLFGKVLCNILKCTVIWVSAKSLYNSSVFKYLYEAARDLAPTIVFLEDLDLYGKDRESSNTTQLLGELLTQLDGISSNEGVFTFATTNNLKVLDEALRRRPSRFDQCISFSCPKEKERELLLRMYLGSRSIDPSVSLGGLVSKTEGLTPAFIQEVIIYAVLNSSGRKDTTLFGFDFEEALKRVVEQRKKLGFHS